MNRKTSQVAPGLPSPVRCPRYVLDGNQKVQVIDCLDEGRIYKRHHMLREVEVERILIKYLPLERVHSRLVLGGRMSPCLLDDMSKGC